MDRGEGRVEQREGGGAQWEGSSNNKMGGAVWGSRKDNQEGAGIGRDRKDNHEERRG